MKFKPSYKQLTIDAFRSSLDGLDKSNRWVWLGDHLPWEVYEKQYGQKLNNQNAGASAKPSRMVIAAMIIKHATRYNVSQVRATNHFGGVETTRTSYSYTGKPLDVAVQHSKNGLGTTSMGHAHTYDGADRMASHAFSIAQGVPPTTTTLTYAYDALGRLSSISRPFTSGDVAYTYDLHGWTTGITTNSFCEELFYADGPGAPRYGGDVSSMRWSSYEHSPKRGYKFSYDDAGRLTQATYGEGNTLTSNANRFSEGVQYDAHGNVTGIVRRGKTSAYTYGLMDNLTLAYDGDRLTGVTETAADYDFSGSFEYKGANGSLYIYNANGSLVADRSRGIAYIAYDDYNKKN